MKALYTFLFILGFVLSLEAFASPDMTHGSGEGAGGFTEGEPGLEQRETAGWP